MFESDEPIQGESAANDEKKKYQKVCLKKQYNQTHCGLPKKQGFRHSGQEERCESLGRLQISGQQDNSQDGRGEINVSEQYQLEKPNSNSLCFLSFQV